METKLMGKHTFGFRKSNENLSEIEKKLGIIFVDSVDDPYPFCLGKCTTINESTGIYQGLSKDFGYLVLFPAISSEKYEELEKLGYAGEKLFVYYWDYETPTVMPQSSVNKINCNRLGHVNKVIEKSQEKLKYLNPLIINPLESDFRSARRMHLKMLEGNVK
jgi:hypothetical protein